MAPDALKDRTAVVTGAGSGIGRALALNAARRGMRLSLCDSSAAGLAETVAAVEALGGGVVSAVADVRDPAALARLAELSEGSIALVFANAGLMRTGALADQSAAELQLMFDVNVMGVIHTLQAFLPRLRAQSERSQIVITGSQASFLDFPGIGGYCASKHALMALGEALAAELAAEGAPVGVSLLAPGSVETNIFGAGASPNAATALSPAAVAEMAFEGALASRAIISTHPGLMAKIETRVARWASDLARE